MFVLWQLSFAFLVFFHDVLGAKNNMFTIKWDHAMVTTYDDDFVKATAGVEFVNRSLKALFIHADFLQEPSEECVMQMNAEKWINNKFHRYNAIQFTENCNKLLTWEWFDLQGFFLGFKPPMIGKWKKGKFDLDKYVVNADNYSPLIPTGYYKAEIAMFNDKKKTQKKFLLEWFLHLIPIQKKAKTK